MKLIRRDKSETYIYYWQPRKRGFIGMRVSRTHAWVIVGNSKDPIQLVVIGPGPTIPVIEERQPSEFAAVRLEMAPGHPELERLLKGDITFDDALASPPAQ
ncbi:MAG TPA: hypothetical protein VL285_08515 [Bryobacteraceae bacterium]|jgi:hypothetical protein|nr:hypothetical protein [Bryobacteraceae bacterium]